MGGGVLYGRDYEGKARSSAGSHVLDGGIDGMARIRAICYGPSLCDDAVADSESDGERGCVSWKPQQLSHSPATEPQCHRATERSDCLVLPEESTHLTSPPHFHVQSHSHSLSHILHLAAPLPHLSASPMQFINCTMPEPPLGGIRKSPVWRLEVCFCLPTVLALSASPPLLQTANPAPGTGTLPYLSLVYSLAPPANPQPATSETFVPWRQIRPP